MNPTPDRTLSSATPVRALARSSITVTPPGRDGMTVELVFLDWEPPEDPDNRTSPARHEDLGVLGIDRHGAGWRHFAVESLDLWVRIIHD